MSGMKIAVVTPVYNRSEEIKTLHSSLVNQSRSDFCWYVVDDGSDDDSFLVVENLKEQSPFPVVLLKKENGGKHTAINAAGPNAW